MRTIWASCINFADIHIYFQKLAVFTKSIAVTGQISFLVYKIAPNSQIFRTTHVKFFF